MLQQITYTQRPSQVGETLWQSADFARSVCMHINNSFANSNPIGLIDTSFPRRCMSL